MAPVPRFSPTGLFSLQFPHQFRILFLGLSNNAMWKRTKAIDAHATPASLSTLSEDTARYVAAWLTVHDLRHVVFASKRLIDSMLYRVYCRDHVRLVLPVDPQACGDAVVAWKRARAAKRVLPTRVVCGLPSQLASALTAVGIQDAIELVEITPTRLFYDRDRIPSGAWEALGELSHFHCILHLVITGASIRLPHMDVLDVAVIADAAPALEILSVSKFSLQHEDAFASLQRLRRLEFYNVQLSSWKFGAELPRLKHFTCHDSKSATNDMNFSQWRPLKILKLAYNSPLLENDVLRAIEHVHLPVVEALSVTGTNHYAMLQVNLAAQPSPRLVDLAIAPHVLVGGVRSLSAMTQLHSLHLCWDGPSYVYSDDYGVEDASPLACLVNLETLKLRMSGRATTCRPLRALTRLRELYLVDGWLRDFVDCLPLLRKLSVEEVDSQRSRTFEEHHMGRSHEVQGHSGYPRLDEVFIGEFVALNSFAMQLMKDTQSLRLELDLFVWKKLFQVSRLTRLTSFELTVDSSVMIEPSRWDGQLCILDSIHTLERLRLHFCDSPMNLAWSLAGATRLRVISLYRVDQGFLEALARSSTTLMNLEEIYLERYEGKSLAPLLELRTLQIIGIEDGDDCRLLRGTRGVGVALPSLRAIHHDGIDCVWLATCPVAARWERMIRGNSI